MSTTTLLTNDSANNSSLVMFSAQPTYQCETHGTVTTHHAITFGADPQRSRYCMLCLFDFMRANMKVLTPQ